MALVDFLGAIKSKEFRETMYGFIDRAGRWGVWVALILASGIVLAISNAEPEWAIGVLVGEASLALGLQIVVPKLNKEKTNETNLTNHRDHDPAL